MALRALRWRNVPDCVYLEFLAAYLAHGVDVVRQFADDVEDDIQHVRVGPAARMQPLPVLIRPASAIVHLIVYIHQPQPLHGIS